MKTIDDAIWICLPKGLSELFNLVKYEKSSTQYDFWLDEKREKSEEDADNPNIVGRGFTEYATVQDFPMRGVPVFLHLRKCKWWDKENNRIFSYELELPDEEGTRLTSEFAAFLKDEGGEYCSEH